MQFSIKEFTAAREVIRQRAMFTTANILIGFYNSINQDIDLMALKKIIFDSVKEIDEDSHNELHSIEEYRLKMFNNMYLLKLRLIQKQKEICPQSNYMLIAIVMAESIKVIEELIDKNELTNNDLLYAKQLVDFIQNLPIQNRWIKCEPDQIKVILQYFNQIFVPIMNRMFNKNKQQIEYIKQYLQLPKLPRNQPFMYASRQMPNYPLCVYQQIINQLNQESTYQINSSQFNMPLYHQNLQIPINSWEQMKQCQLNTIINNQQMMQQNFNFLYPEVINLDLQNQQQQQQQQPQCPIYSYQNYQIYNGMIPNSPLANIYYNQMIQQQQTQSDQNLLASILNIPSLTQEDFYSIPPFIQSYQS